MYPNKNHSYLNDAIRAKKVAAVAIMFAVLSMSIAFVYARSAREAKDLATEYREEASNAYDEMIRMQHEMSLMDGELFALRNQLNR